MGEIAIAYFITAVSFRRETPLVLPPLCPKMLRVGLTGWQQEERRRERKLCTFCRLTVHSKMGCALARGRGGNQVLWTLDSRPAERKRRGEIDDREGVRFECGVSNCFLQDVDCSGRVDLAEVRSLGDRCLAKEGPV